MTIDSRDKEIHDRLEALIALTPFPPFQQSYDWRAIETELSIQLPVEYKRYAERFPSGLHRGIEVFHPDGPGGFGLVQQVRQYSTMFQGFIPAEAAVGGSGIHHVYQFYPRSGGLVPWAMYEAAAGLCWYPNDDDPDKWPVVAYCDIGPTHEVIEGSTLEALMRVVRGEAGMHVFPSALADDLIEFLPMNPDLNPRL